MRDYDRSTARQHTLQRTLYQQLGLCIDVGGSFIENNNSGISNNGAGETDKLPLSHAEVHSPFRQYCVVPVLQIDDEIVSPNCSGRVNNLLQGGILFIVADVFLPLCLRTDMAPAGPCSSAPPGNSG